jgi:hydrogenase maturation protein HypF
MKMIEQMLDRQVNTPQTSSAGRLFDAVAALCGVRDRVTYEGQAAVELEWLASGVPVDRGYPFELVWDTHSPSADGPDPPAEQFGYRVGPLVIDTRPLITAVAHEANQGVTPAVIARRFHTTLVEIVAEVCSQLRATGGPDAVVLSGGVFLNALLTSEVSSRLQSAGLRVYRHRLVPPGDGGLSLGQLAIAACHSRKS